MSFLARTVLRQAVPRQTPTPFLQRRWNTDLRSKIQSKSPMELVNEVPPRVVDTPVVACNGGDQTLTLPCTDQRVAHPIEYIRVNRDTPSRCKYCSLQFIRRRE